MAYDSSNREVSTGMFGALENTNPPITVASRTYLDTDHPLQTGGTLSKIQMTVYSVPGNKATSAKIAIFRPNGSDYDIVGSAIDITAHINASEDVRTGGLSNRWYYDTSVTYGAQGPVYLSSITVQAGDVLAYYGSPYIVMTIPVLTGFDVKYIAGDQMSGTILGAGMTTEADNCFSAEAYVETNEPIILDNDNAAAGFTTGDVVNLPYFPTGITSYVFEGVAVPNGESLSLKFQYREAGTITESADIGILLDFTGVTDIIDLINWNDVVQETMDVVFAADDKYTIVVTLDPDAATVDSVKVSFMNLINGQGNLNYAADSLDISYPSLTNNKWDTRANQFSTNVPPNKLVIEQASGVGATIDKIVVARKLQVLPGDSYVSKHVSDAAGIELNHVGEKLANTGTWSEDRYPIIGGVPGDPQLTDVGSIVAAISHRYSGVKSALWDIPNSLYVFANGPGINDINSAGLAPTTTEEAKALGETLAAGVQSMASRAIRSGSDVVLQECNYLAPGDPDDTEFKRLAVTTFNEALAVVSTTLQVPIAQTAIAVRDHVPTYYDDGLHMTSDGDQFMADAIVTAYETNTIVSVAEAMSIILKNSNTSWNDLYNNGINDLYNSGVNEQYG